MLPVLPQAKKVFNSLDPPQRFLHKNRSEKSQMGRKTESLHSRQSLVCLCSSLFFFICLWSAKETFAEERRSPTRKHCTCVLFLKVERRIDKYYQGP